LRPAPIRWCQARLASSCPAFIWAFELDRALGERGAGSALIVGAGCIGLVMAESLSHRGLSVTLVEQLPEGLGPTSRRDPQHAAGRSQLAQT
jgi:NADPH-dependent 2,4-dienoyl-CoA reductase/sulfur reductase-like enzyme